MDKYNMSFCMLFAEKPNQFSHNSSEPLCPVYLNNLQMWRFHKSDFYPQATAKSVTKQFINNAHLTANSWMWANLIGLLLYCKWS